jgi:hypothetical protein
MIRFLTTCCMLVISAGCLGPVALYQGDVPKENRFVVHGEDLYFDTPSGLASNVALEAGQITQARLWISHVVGPPIVLKIAGQPGKRYRLRWRTEPDPRRAPGNIVGGQNVILILTLHDEESDAIVAEYHP